jgi:cytoskeletal protein CcmA (bactofilin family)
MEVKQMDESKKGLLKIFVALVVVALGSSKVLAATLGGDLLTFDGTSSVVKIDFNKGGSDIRDDGNLWINTDDSVFFHAPTSVVMWTDALEFWPNMTKPTIDFKKGGSKIYDDGNLFIVTDDNLYLQGTVIPKGTVRPDVDDTYDLGTSSRQWRNLYVDGTAYIDSLQAQGTIVASGSIYGSPADAYDLGTNNEEWRRLYLGDQNNALQFGQDQDITVGYDTTNTALEILGDAVSIGSWANATTAAEAGDLLVTGDLEVNGAGDFDGNMDVDGTSNLDEVDVDGTVQIDATTTVGTNGSGYDVTFYGATTGANFLWDSSANLLKVTGSGGTDAIQVATGNTNIDGNMDVAGTSNLDEVSIQGTAIFGADGTAYDSTWYSDITGDNMAWDDATAKLTITGSAGTDALNIAAGNLTMTGVLDVDYTANLDEVAIAGNTTVTGDVTLTGNLDVDYTSNLDELSVQGTAVYGADGTGYSSTWYSDISGDSMAWSDTAAKLTITGSAGTDALNIAAGNLTLTGVLDVDYTANLDELSVQGAAVYGADGTGYGSTWYSDISGDSMAWSDTAAKLTITGSAGTDALDVVDGDVYIEDVLKLGKQAVTTNATPYTATVSASYMEVTFGTAGDDLVLSTTGASEGDVLIIVNVGANSGDLDGDTATMKIDGGVDLALPQYNGVIFIFDGANWIQLTTIPGNS